LTESVTRVERTQDRPNYTLTKVTFVFGIVLLTAIDFFYLLNRSEFYNLSAPPAYSYASLLIFVLATVSIGISLFSFLRIQQEIPPVADASMTFHWRPVRIISDAVFQQRRLFVIATAIYAVVFALLDGILVYQPNVNFFTYYLVNGPTWHIVTCCGTPPYVPVGLLYLPAQHLGVELFPLSVSLMLIVSLLVGLNVSLLFRAFSLTRTGADEKETSRRKGVAASVLGAAFGLFAGCPTCAAVFFLSMVAGTGATAFSTLIAEYQPLIVALTIPLLSFSIFWQSRSIGTILQGCSLKAETK